jgi:FMN phosphatase YigB (HAD superfamily)
VRAGYRLGILSNVDDDLLAATRRQLGVLFDVVVTAEQVHSYKPAQGHFMEARRRIGGARWLHAAQSFFHDVVPARALGIPVAWINRKRESASGGIAPDLELRDLTGLADALG